MNIPIYRGLKLGTENEYVEGFYFNRKNMLGKIIYHKIDFSTTCDSCVAIDPTTLSVHFPDITDSKGNKIFASLSEDGKGGDMVEVTIPFRKQEYKYECYVYYKNTRIKTSSFEVNSAVSKEYKVIGIQK